MSLLTRFTRRPNVQAAAPVWTNDSDYAYRAAWGLTLGEWLELTEAARRDRRDRVVYAPNFRAGTK